MNNELDFSSMGVSVIAANTLKEFQENVRVFESQQTPSEKRLPTEKYLEPNQETSSQSETLDTKKPIRTRVRQSKLKNTSRKSAFTKREGASPLEKTEKKGMGNTADKPDQELLSELKDRCKTVEEAEEMFLILRQAQKPKRSKSDLLYSMRLNRLTYRKK